MNPGVLTIMLPCSTSPTVDEAIQLLEWSAQIGNDAAISVSWSERHGAKETSISERWKRVAPNMYVAM